MCANQSEYISEHLEGATNMPLDLINDYLNDFNQDTPFTFTVRVVTVALLRHLYSRVGAFMEV